MKLTKWELHTLLRNECEKLSLHFMDFISESNKDKSKVTNYQIEQSLSIITKIVNATIEGDYGE